MSYYDDGCHGTRFDGVPDDCHSHDHCCPPPHYADCHPNGGSGDGHCGPMPKHCGGPLPAPIPPLCIVPGMNSQEQMCHVINKTNECIGRWNAIQENCYDALNKCVGAAVSNGVYYDCGEVKLVNGYSEDDNCPYSYVRIKAVDKAGKPIYMRLKPAYGNTGNNGARQSMQDASFIYSANTIITAINPADGTWSGPAIMDGCPVEYTQSAGIEGSVIYGFNRGGAMLCFDMAVTIETLKQCRMVNAIGPGIQILKDGEITAAAEKLTTAASIQAIGYKASCGEKVFFSCGKEDALGMQGVNVARALKNMGCTTAVITCLQPAYPDITGSTYVGKREAVTPAADAVQQKSGLTGGAMFLGRQLNAPLEWQMPYNQAFWFVTKKPQRGFRNDFTTEVADLTQSLGGNVNNMANVNNTINGIKVDILEATQKVEKLEGQVAGIADDVAEITTRLDTLEPKVDAIEENVAQLQECCKTVQEYMVTETAERKAADADLATRITNVQTAIQEEATARNDADNRLIEAIQNEASARATNDAKLDTKIDSEVAKLEAAIQDIEVAAYTAGEGITINNRVISVNKDEFPDNQKIKDLENQVDAIPKYTAGENITFTQSGGTTAISADLTDIQDDLDDTKTLVQENTDRITAIEADVGANGEAIEKLTESTTKLEGDVAGLQEAVKDANITAGNGISVEERSDTKVVSVKIDNTLSFQPDGSLHVDIPAPEEGETTKAGFGISIAKADGIANIAVNPDVVATQDDIKQIKDGAVDLPYVKKTGDTMSGNLTGTTFTSNRQMAMKDNNTSHHIFAVDDTETGLEFGGTVQDAVFSERVTVRNVKKPVGNTDATPKDYVDEQDRSTLASAETAIGAAKDELNASIDAAKNELQQNINVIDEAQTELQEQFSNLEDGTVELPYVKKTGDSMSGPLSLVDAAGNVLGQIALTQEGLMILGGPAATGGHVTIKGDSVSVDKPMSVNGTISASDGVNPTDVATVGQLNAKPSGISQATADGRYIAKTNGVSTTPITFSGASDAAGWANLCKKEGVKSATISDTGLWVNTASNNITGSSRVPVVVGEPLAAAHAATKGYSDGKFIAQTGGTATTGITYNITPDDNGWEQLVVTNGVKQYMINKGGLFQNKASDTIVKGNAPVPILVGAPLQNGHAANKSYVDTAAAARIADTGGVSHSAITFDGAPDANGWVKLANTSAAAKEGSIASTGFWFNTTANNKAANSVIPLAIATPVTDQHAATKKYVDDNVYSIIERDVQIEVSADGRVLGTMTGKEIYNFTSHQHIVYCNNALKVTTAATQFSFKWANTLVRAWHIVGTCVTIGGRALGCTTNYIDMSAVTLYFNGWSAVNGDLRFGIFAHDA